MSTNTSKDMQLSIIHRKAINISGSPGALYDQCQDQIVEHLNVNAKDIKISKLKTAHCEIINYGTDDRLQLFQNIRIQDDLQLSGLLNIVPKTGLLSLIDNPDPINEYTRVLHYTYTRLEEKLPYNAKQINELIMSLRHPIIATHIITEVRRGIDLVVVLQLSEKLSPEWIDPVLEKICYTLNTLKYEPLVLDKAEEKLSKNNRRVVGYSFFSRYNRSLHS